MPLASRRSVPAAAALLFGSCLAAASPAAAFKVIDSPGHPGCAVWANDAGQPLTIEHGGRIGRKVPCGDGPRGGDVYDTLFGEAPGTLVTRDAVRKIECILALVPGSATVVRPKVCQGWAGG